jgi:hypothetical protein
LCFALRVSCLTLVLRFLIDTDQDDEGLRVIADFHDGNMDDPITRSEYTEIKEAILADVGLSAVPKLLLCANRITLASCWSSVIRGLV